MSRLRTAALALAAGAIASTAAASAAAATPTPTPTPTPTEIVGQLGYEGGAFPGGFHPTAGTVDVEFTLEPLILVKKVGPSGTFRIPLGPGTYTLIGCGPSSTSARGLCGRPVTVTLSAGEIDHVRLVWALTP